MTIQIRPMQPEDVETCGRICYEAFKGIAERHNFRKDFPSPELAIGLTQHLLADPGVFNVVAESEGQVIGSNHLQEHDAIAGVGPITIEPDAQAKGVGRMLMQAVIERGKNHAGIRLLQDSFNMASLSLYASLGFDVREPVVIIEGAPRGEIPAGYEVRPIREEDYDACAEVCRSVHGFDRLNELKHTPPAPNPFVALRGGRLTAYISAPQFWPLNHAVAETEEDMLALLIGVSNQCTEPLSVLLPTRQATLFRWCLKNGMRAVKPMTLMSMGEYHAPRGCYLPSVGY
ncbi:MAG: GNAT family N-acetyltransferase [Acidobacteria bacterium]|nr:GNAT family N-acetyltransferase [Acidobacteriota bacterium]MCA1627341.1 GNAT family N-acetyltransferase [Acidobacteriota bacterium]